MKRRELVAAIAQSVYELTTVPAHIPDDRKYTRDELAAYHDGYYVAIGRAVLVVELTVRRKELVEREQRKSRKGPAAA